MDLREEYMSQIQKVQLELEGMLGEGSFLYKFAIGQPSDFYIDDRVKVKNKRRIIKIINGQLIPLYRKVGWQTGHGDTARKESPKDLAYG